MKYTCEHFFKEPFTVVLLMDMIQAYKLSPMSTNKSTKPHSCSIVILSLHEHTEDLMPSFTT